MAAVAVAAAELAGMVGEVDITSDFEVEKKQSLSPSFEYNF